MNTNNVWCVYKHTSPSGKVYCVSTGQIFDNISDASKSTGISRRAISYVRNGKHKTSGGLMWKFIT